MKWQEYSVTIKKAIDNFAFDEGIISILKHSIPNNQTIFIAGNGGSAAIASHYTCDLSKGANKDWSENFKRYKAICLSNNICYLTAIANDASYEDVFKQQLINLAKPNDIVILISSSGFSPNIVRAAEYAKNNNMIVIGITGFSGGTLKKMCHYSAHLPINSYELCEDIHSIFGHFLATCLKESDS